MSMNVKSEKFKFKQNETYTPYKNFNPNTFNGSI